MDTESDFVFFSYLLSRIICENLRTICQHKNMSGVRIAGEGTSYFHFAYSADINSCLSVKIGSLEGQLPKPDYEQVKNL